MSRHKPEVGTILHGIKALSRFLQENPARFASAPILLISNAGNSGPGSSTADLCARQVQFLLQQQLAYRTVILSTPSRNNTKALPSNAGTLTAGSTNPPGWWPTRVDVDHGLDLASRIGATTVVAVGSETALHLGKALMSSTSAESPQQSATTTHAWEELVLIPTDMSATLTSSLQRGLLFDPVEDLLIPVKEVRRDLSDPLSKTNTTTVLVDAALPPSASRSMALTACIGVALDSALGGPAHDSKAVHQMLSTIEHCLQEMINNDFQISEVTRKDASRSLGGPWDAMLLEAGANICFGANRAARSIILAGAAALGPHWLPQHSFLTLAEAWAPALAQEVDLIQDASVRERLVQLLATMGPLQPLQGSIGKTTEQDLVQSIRSSQYLWDCQDVAPSLLHRVVKNVISGNHR